MQEKLTEHLQELKEVQEFIQELKQAIKRLKDPQARGVPDYKTFNTLLELVERELRNKQMGYEITQDLSMGQIHIATNYGVHTISILHLDVWHELVRLRKFIKACKQGA